MYSGDHDMNLPFYSLSATLDGYIDFSVELIKIRELSLELNQSDYALFNFIMLHCVSVYTYVVKFDESTIAPFQRKL